MKRIKTARKPTSLAIGDYVVYKGEPCNVTDVSIGQHEPAYSLDKFGAWYDHSNPNLKFVKRATPKSLSKVYADLEAEYASNEEDDDGEES